MVLALKCPHIEVIHHNDMAQQAQMVHHIQKRDLNQIYLMEVHKHEVVPHKIAGREKVHWMAGEDWEDNSEVDKVPLPHGDLMKVVVVGD